jgi:2-polyprenyl-6-methoxyphenol hydroxylase-like FAD-dependent oxidoreductase
VAGDRQDRLGGRIEIVRAVVIGGGVVGLSTAMLLGRDGHEVTLLERDPAPPPDTPDALWESWERRGVNQFRMLHYFLPRFRATVEAELPDAVRSLEAFGALRAGALDAAPESITGGRRAADDRFVALTARRPVAEAALSQAASATAGVTIRRGVGIDALLAGVTSAPATPHVVGVRTGSGEEIAADLVVDASGRRSNLPARLDAIGARPVVEELEDCGFVYYGRHFRSPDGRVPPNLGPLLQHYGSVSVLTLPADNGTWGLGIVASAHDAPMRALRDVAHWEATWRSFPLVAHWLDAGAPISDGVAIMAKIEDRHRSFVTDGEPVATGVVAVGDAWACTNPSVGRGSTIGLLHAVALRDLLREAAVDPQAFARAWHDATLRTTEPWYRATLSYDRHRLGEIEALRCGTQYETDDPVYAITKALEFGSASDPDLLRAYLAVAAMQALPDEAVAAPGVFEKVLAIGDSWRDADVPAPDRAGLLELVGA